MSVDDEFTGFAAARWQPLLRVARFMGCDHQSAEDAAQTTLIKCFLSWAKVQKAVDTDAYVATILINTIRSEMRRTRQRMPVPTERLTGVALEDPTSAVDSNESLSRALARLSIGARQVVVLRYIYGLSERQTADALHLPAGTVKSRLSRALAQLANDRHLSDSTERRGS